MSDNKEFIDTIKSVGEKVDSYKETVTDLTAQVQQMRKSNGKLGATGGTGETMEMQLSKLITDNYATLKNIDPRDTWKFESKFMTSSGSLTGGTYQTGVDRIPVSPFWPYHLRDLIPVIPVQTGNVLFPKETSPIIGSGSFSFPGASNTKPEVDYSITTGTLSLQFMAGLTRIAIEMLQDLPWLLTYVSNRLVEDLKVFEDASYMPTLIAGAVTGSTAETLAAAKILDYWAQIIATGHRVSGAVCHPTTLVSLLKTKPDNYSVPLGIRADDFGNVLLLGAPVVVSPLIAANHILIGDFARGAGIAQCGGLSMRSTEYNSDDFSRNLMSFRAEVRAGLMLFSPASFVYGTV